MLKVGSTLPEVPLINTNGSPVSLSTLTKPNTVFFFWTEKAKSHLEAVHLKIMTLKSKFPQYNFVAVNINDSQEDWKKTLDKYKFNGVIELHCSDFETIKNNWAINKIYRTIILDNKGLIKNAFANIFDSQFEANLK
jgi:peroxiredoxin